MRPLHLFALLIRPRAVGIRIGLGLVALAGVGADSAVAAVKLASVFGENMVVQRDRPAAVWGTASPNATVHVTLGKESAEAKTDAAGRFSAVIPAQSSGGPFVLQASDGDEAVTLKDVYLGDVWLCGGQSNMQMSLGEADNGDAAAAAASRHQRLRLCKIGQAWTDTPQTDCKANWTPASKETALKFSAVGYFFGSALSQSPTLDGVAIGLVEADLGGTLAEAWTPQDELATIQGKAENSMFGIRPTTLYNGMIAPLGKMNFKGVLWYQGEGNSGDPASYPSKLTAMIRGWRKQFDQPTLPFLVVQLPDYAPAWGNYYWQWTRDAQQQVANTVPAVHLVAGIQTNDGLDLHPKPKQAIGERSALLARQTVYGETIVGRGPVFKSVKIDGNRALLSFDTSGSALSAVGPNDVKGFLLAGEDGQFHVARSRIEGDKVVLQSDDVPIVKFIRYAWAGVPNATLTNREGLPAYPFRTDSLPMDTVGQTPKQ